ncbi:MAG: class B sortase [Oscillospiraceae bacterium]|nr:class B sortase [Oscillospiraceae bacterium]
MSKDEAFEPSAVPVPEEETDTPITEEETAETVPEKVSDGPVPEEETDGEHEPEAEEASAEASAQDAQTLTKQDKLAAIRAALQERENAQEDPDPPFDPEASESADAPSESPPNKETTEQKKTEKRTGKKKRSGKKTPGKQQNEKKKKRKKKRKKVPLGKRLRGLFPQKGDSVFEAIRKSIFLVSTAIFIVCLCLIGDYFIDNYRNKVLNDDFVVRRQRRTDADEAVASENNISTYYRLLPSVEDLLAVNPDVVGYITIPGTRIGYPVLQKRGQEDGNEYYLHRNIQLEEARPGSIFLDYRNNFDYVVAGEKQAENSENLIIYGHNMHDYAMFGSLKYYINDAEYYDAHPIVELNSNYKKYKYKIFAMILVDIDDETDTRFDYWNTLDFDDEQQFYDYVNEIKRRTVRLTDVDIAYGDQLLTLSTCNSTFTEGRLVVFARLLRDGESLEEGTTSVANPNIKWPNSYYKWHKNTYDPDAEFVPYG